MATYTGVQFFRGHGVVAIVGLCLCSVRLYTDFTVVKTSLRRCNPPTCSIDSRWNVCLPSQLSPVCMSCSVFEKTWSATQKNVKSHVFWILKKNVKKTYVVSQAT